MPSTPGIIILQVISYSLFYCLYYFKQKLTTGKKLSKFK